MKTIHAPHLGQSIKLGGRKRPQNSHHYAPRLENYLRPDITVPESTTYRMKYDPSLELVYLNDQLGDCVIAARYHRVGQITAVAGTPFVATNAQVLADYERVGGYNPKHPESDGGCDMVTNNNDAVERGYADGSKDLGWVSVNAANKLLVQQAVYCFEGSVDVGIELPDAWVTPFPEKNGFVWDVAGEPNPENGHCMQILDYDSTGVQVATWGLWGTITWAALAKYAVKSAYGECYLHVNPDQVAKSEAKAPNGIAWSQLIRDFNELGGSLVVPPDPPAPVVHEGITLVQARALVSVAFKKVPNGIAKQYWDRAEQTALKALLDGWF